MTDRDLDARISHELTAYGATAVRPIDAVELATAALATAGSARVGSGARWRIGLRSGWSMPRSAAIVVLLAMLVATVGFALVAGGYLDRLRTIHPPPATTNDLLFAIDMRRDPQDHACVDVWRIGVATDARRQVVSCGDQIGFTRDGSRIAVGGRTGLTTVDTRDGSSITDLSTDVWTRPVAWSPSGRWLETARCTPLPGDACTLEIVAADGSTRAEVPNETESGYFCCPAWTPDESRVYLPTGDMERWLEADADGTDIRSAQTIEPTPRWYAQDGRIVALAPDGASIAYADGPSVDGGHTLKTDAWVASPDGRDARSLTNVPEGHFIEALAWSPDGRTLAVIDVDAGLDELAVPPNPPVALHLVDVAGGASRTVTTPPLHRLTDDGFDLTWSPDGRRVAVTMGNGEPSSSTGRARGSASLDTVIATVDGSAPPVLLQDARGPIWSPDGRSIAYVATTGSRVHWDVDPWPPATIVVADADGSHQTTVVVAADMVTPLGDPSIWFVWAGPD